MALEKNIITESSRDNLLLPYLNILNQKGINCNLGELKNYLMKKFVVEANIHALSLNSNYYLSGVARYYFNGDLTTNRVLNIFNSKVKDEFKYDVCQRLDEIIVYLRNAYIDTTGTAWEQPEDFGELSIAKLFRKYGGKIDKLKQKENKNKTIVQKSDFTNNVGKDYTYEIMYTHDDCKKYNSYTSPGAWCITYGEQHFDYYIKHPASHFIIFKKNGYENIKRSVGKNFPLDEYGLSLIAVRQYNSKCSFVGATTRWNHGSTDSPSISNADKAMTYEELCQITGLDDIKWQSIYDEWKSNQTTYVAADRGKIAADRLNIARKFKYAQMLYRNGTSIEKLIEDGVLYKNGKILQPIGQTLKTVNPNKSIITLTAESGDAIYWTIFDKGSFMVDKVLADNIQAGTQDYGLSRNLPQFFLETFASCHTKSGKIIYSYKTHDVLNINGNKYFKTLSTIKSSENYLIAENSHGGKSLISISSLKPLQFPNGEYVCEIPVDVGDGIIKIVYDSSAGTYFYFNTETNTFIDSLSGYNALTPGSTNAYFCNGQYEILGIEDFHIIVTQSYDDEGRGGTYKLFNIKTNSFISFDGNDTFNRKEFVNGYLYLGVINSGYIYDLRNNKKLTYPDGTLVVAENIGALSKTYDEADIKYYSMVITIDYSNNLYSIFDFYTNKFYENKNGGWIFKYYGAGKVYGENGGVYRLPERADGEYWYSNMKTENSDVQRLLDEGVDINEIFDKIVPLYIKHGNGSYDNIGDMRLSRVELNSICNVIIKDENGKYRLLSENQWFDSIGSYFSCGLLNVKLLKNRDSENPYYYYYENYIDTNGKLLLKDNINLAQPFDPANKRALIMPYYSKYNVITPNGDFLLEASAYSINKAFGYGGDYYYIRQSRRQRNFKYLSLNGHIFNNSKEAVYDTNYGTPSWIEREQNTSGNNLNESKNRNVDFYGEYPIFSISGEGLDKYSHIVEDIIMEGNNNFNSKTRCITRESLDELCTSSDLSNVIQSFDVKKELNQEFWQDEKLSSKVRLRLLDVAHKFFNDLEVGWVKPKDVIMTGSLCNYNWSKFSDVDLHILVDFEEVDERTPFVKDYFDAKKKIWNETHDSLTIYGFPVELYVQDENEEHIASGMYSLYKDEWIKKPEYDDFESVNLDKETISNKVRKIVDKIDSMDEEASKENDTEKLDILSKKVKELFDNIKGMRKDALKHGGEYSFGNIIFKALRRLGYIGKLAELKNKTYDKINAIR